MWPRGPNRPSVWQPGYGFPRWALRVFGCCSADWSNSLSENARMRSMSHLRLAARARFLICGIPWFWPIVAFIYLFYIPYYAKLNNPNENARVYQIRAVVEFQKLSVNEQIARFGPTNDLASVGNKLYSGKAPGMTFVGIPVYAALHAIDTARGSLPTSPFRLLYTLRLFGVLLPVLGFLIAFRRFLNRFGDNKQFFDFLTIVLATGTMLLPYSLIFVNHSLTAASACGSLMAAESFNDKMKRKIHFSAYLWIFLAGFLLAFSTAADHALFPISCLLLIYCVSRTGFSLLPIVFLCAGAFIPTAATAIYNHLCWGHLFKTSIGFLANPEFAKNQSQGLFGLVGPKAIAIYNLLISPAKGLFFFSPVLVFAPVALTYASARSQFKRMAVLSLIILCWMILYACSLTNWDAGWTVGPRYATVIVPFGILGIGIGWSSIPSRIRAFCLPMFIVFSIISIIFTVSTSVLFPHLPPKSQNPVFELIWPLWRDGMTPHTLIEPCVVLSGRAAQVPFLLAFCGLLMTVLSKGVSVFGSNVGWLRSRFRKVVLGCVFMAVAGIFIYRVSTFRTPNRRTVLDTLTWIEKTIWEPKRSFTDGTSHQ